MNIYVFGNELVQEDSVALRMVPQLQRAFPNITFTKVDPNEDFPPQGERDLVIMDAVKGISKPMCLHFSDLKDIARTPISPHDYDLLMHLLLLKKMNRINTVTIVGVPMRKFEKNTICEVTQLIEDLIRAT